MPEGRGPRREEIDGQALDLGKRRAGHGRALTSSTLARSGTHSIACPQELRRSVNNEIEVLIGQIGPRWFLVNLNAGARLPDAP